MKNEKDLKLTVENLITAGTTYDMEQLDVIYHNDLQLIMLDPSGQKMVAGKNEIKHMFQMKLDNNEPHLNTWANFHHVEVKGDTGHVLISRKIKMMQEEQDLTLSIDLIWEENRWQVNREVIVALPDSK